MSASARSRILATIPTRGAFQGLRLLCLFAALGMMAVQLAYAYKAAQPGSNFQVPYYPVIVAAVLFLLFLLLGRTGGVLNIERRRIHGKRSMGVAFDIPMEAVAEVELMGKSFALKAADGRLLLVETPKEARAAGLVWLCKHYGDWPDGVWEAFSSTSPQRFPKAIRYFLDEGGAPSFGDNGFLVTSNGQRAYFPETTMFSVQSRNSGTHPAHSRTQSHGAPLVLLDPNPDSLPLAALCSAILTATLSPEQQKELLAELLEAHGGNFVTGGTDAATLEGECLGHAVQVTPM